MPLSPKRLAVLAVLCLGLLFCSTHEAQAQAASDYASTAYADPAVRFCFLSPDEETWAAPDARKDPRSARKSRQEAGRRPPYHSLSPPLERKEQ
jgi:hypothetical protein